jgi:hypothetical protein
MLPDFPDIKKQINRIQRIIMTSEFDKRAPLLKTMRQLVQQEGDRHEYETEDGDYVTEPYHEVKAPIEIKIADLGTITMANFRDRIEKAVDEMARQSMVQLFQTLDKVTSKAGTSFDAAGQSWTPDLFLDSLERTEIGFDENGKPDITIVLHPDLLKSIRERYPNLEQDPNFKKRHYEIIAKKREAWLDRENNRKLVG